MLVSQEVVIASWLIFIIYWVLNWRRVKPTQSTKWNFRKHVVFMIGLIVLGAVLRLSGVLNFCLEGVQVCKNNGIIRVIDISSLWQGVSIFFLIGGLVIAIAARKTLGDNWSSRVVIKKDHKLIVRGVYAYVRHPIYSGVLCMCAGTLMNLDLNSGLSIFVFIFLLLLFKSKREEELLLEYFGKEYSEYMARTKMLVPFVY